MIRNFNKALSNLDSKHSSLSPDCSARVMTVEARDQIRSWPKMSKVRKSESTLVSRDRYVLTGYGSASFHRRKQMDEGARVQGLKVSTLDSIRANSTQFDAIRFDVPAFRRSRSDLVSVLLRVVKERIYSDKSRFSRIEKVEN